MPNSIISIQLYCLDVSLGNWIGREVVAIVSSESDGVAVIIVVVIVGGGGGGGLEKPFALDCK